jgi:hypothetical protein
MWSSDDTYWAWRYPIAGWDVLMLSFLESDDHIPASRLPLNPPQIWRWKSRWEKRGLIDTLEGRGGHGGYESKLRVTMRDLPDVCRAVVEEFPRIDATLHTPLELAALLAMPISPKGIERHTVSANRLTAAFARLCAAGWIQRDGQATIATLPECIETLASCYRQLLRQPPTPLLGTCIHQRGIEAAWLAPNHQVAYQGPRRLGKVDQLLLRMLGRKVGGSALEATYEESLQLLDLQDLTSAPIVKRFQFYGLESELHHLRMVCNTLCGLNGARYADVHVENRLRLQDMDRDSVVIIDA